jgi:hypothetical protein
LALTRSIAAEGEAHGIKANSLNPGAFTLMVDAQQSPGSPMYQHARENLPAELVSPVVAWLAHESCAVSGECIEAAGGEVRRFYFAQTQGYASRALTPESVAEHWHEVIAGTADSIIPHGTSDPQTWRIKPYRSSTST